MSDSIPSLSLFISSPGDVSEERILAGRVIARLNEALQGQLKLVPVFWEHEPMLMSGSFQTQIPTPSNTDIFICILWSRIGTRLPAHLTRPDGSRYASGTEFEFEDAWASFKTYKRPDLLVYRKNVDPPFLQNSKLPDFEARLAQKNALDDFFRKWFQDEEGSFTAAFNPYDNLAQFEERLDIHLRKLLARRLPAGQFSRPTPARWNQGSPFRGLGVFEAAHAPVFFGRTRAIGEVLDALRKQAQAGRPFIAIFGMSGSGKSSLVRAGVLPLLTQAGVIEGVGSWCQALCRPTDLGNDLALSIARILLAAGGVPQQHLSDTRQLESLLREAALHPDQASATQALREFIAEHLALHAASQGLVASQVKLLLVVDQFEEIFTHERFTPHIRHFFVAFINALVRSGHAFVLTTCRSDFYHRIAELSQLVALLEGHGQYLLPPPGPSEISQMIRLPAFAAGLHFGNDGKHGQSLDETLLDNMASNPQNLALLEFTLDRLYQQRDADNTLTQAAYQQMGGLEGALAAHAEAVFLSCSPGAQAAFPRLMRTLVTLNSLTDTPTTGRRTLHDQAPIDLALDELLQAFIQARLVVTDRTPNGMSVARVAHEALLHHWPRLQQWLVQDRHLLQLRVKLTEAAEFWDKQARPTTLLLATTRSLAEGEELLTHWETVIRPLTVQYIHTSLQEAEQQRALLQAKARHKLRRSRQLTAMFALLCLLSTGSGYLAYRGQQQAEQEAKQAKEAQHLAQHRQVDLQIALAQHYNTIGDTSTGLQQALPALRAVVTQAGAQRNAASAALYDSLSQLRQARVLRGHKDAVDHAVFSPDGLRALTASEDGRACLWTVANGQVIRCLDAQAGFVSHALFNPSGQQILTVTADHVARLWDTDTGRLLHSLAAHQDTLNDACFSPDGKTVLLASLDGSATLWDSANGTLQQRYRGASNSLFSAVFSPDGQQLLIAGDQGAQLWSVKPGKNPHPLQDLPSTTPLLSAVFSPDATQLLTVAGNGLLTRYPRHSATADLRIDTGIPIWQAIYSPDGRWLAVATQEHRILLYDAAKGQLLHSFNGHGAAVYQVLFTPDSQQLLSVSDRVLRIWNPTDRRLLAHLPGHRAAIHTASLSPDGRSAITAALDHTARIWHLNGTDPAFMRLQGHQQTVYYAAYSPDGQRLATASDDATIRIWDSQQGQLLHRLRGHQAAVSQVAFSPDGKRLVSASFDHSARIWDSSTGEVLHVLNGHSDQLWCAHFSPDGRQILTAAGDWENPQDHTARLWDADTGQVRWVLDGHGGAVRWATFSPDGRTVLTASADGYAALWDSDSGQLLQTLHNGAQAGLTYASFAPNGTQAVTVASDGGIQRWQLTRNAAGVLQVTVLPLLRSNPQALVYAAYSPDSRLLVTAGRSNQAQLWRSATGEALGGLPGHQDWVTQAAFSPDGRLLVTASLDNRALLWSLAADGLPDSEPVAVLSAHLGRVSQAVFRPDGQQIATVSLDHEARLWPVLTDPAALIARAESQLP